MTTPVQPTTTSTNTTALSMPATTYSNITVPQTRYFTEEDLERVRQQEKDKLYDRLEKTNSQLNEFKSTVDSLMADKKHRDEEIARQKSEAEKETQRLQQEKLSVQELLEKHQAENLQREQQRQAEWDLKLATMQKEQTYLQLKAYIQRRINEEINATTVIPDLAEYITGDTEEQVEASIKKAQDKTAAIVQATMGSSSPSFPMGTSPTGAPFSPLDNLAPTNRQLTREQIAGMSMKDYAAYREQSGLSRAGSGAGLFS
jgi:hypothetical protein